MLSGETTASDADKLKMPPAADPSEEAIATGLGEVRVKPKAAQRAEVNTG